MMHIASGDCRDMNVSVIVVALLAINWLGLPGRDRISQLWAGGRREQETVKITVALQLSWLWDTENFVYIWHSDHPHLESHHEYF